MWHSGGVPVHTNIIDSHLGKRIREIRERQGLMLVEVATALSVPLIELADYEAGRQRISASGLFLLTQALGVSVHEIYDGLATSINIDSGPNKAVITPDR
jgi:transcriptional regulator with XRE-family HTH domain